MVWFPRQFICLLALVWLPRSCQEKCASTFTEDACNGAFRAALSVPLCSIKTNRNGACALHAVFGASARQIVLRSCMVTECLTHLWNVVSNSLWRRFVSASLRTQNKSSWRTRDTSQRNRMLGRFDINSSNQMNGRIGQHVPKNRYDTSNANTFHEVIDVS